MRRFTTKASVLFLILGSIAPLATTAQTPQASPAASPVAASDGWRVVDQRPITPPGQYDQFLSMSPDGKWLVGLGDKGQVCVWDIATLAPTCAGDSVRPGRFTFAWAPDSTAVAFIDGQVAEPEKPNVLRLFSIETGVVTALAGTGEPVFHAAPSWTPDSQRIVYRQVQPPAVSPDGTAIMYVDRSGGEPQRVPLPVLPYLSVVPAADGWLYFITGRSIDEGDAVARTTDGIWRVRLDGSGREQVLAASDMPATPPGPIADISADERYLLVWSYEQNTSGPPFNLNVFDLKTRSLTPVQTDSTRTVLTGVFAPDGSVAITLIKGDDGPGRLETVDAQTGQVQPVVGEEVVRGVSPGRVTSWSEGNRLLYLSGDGGAVLLTLEPAP